MNWNIYINQKAIVEVNETLIKKLDVKDAIILDWLIKFEPKANKLNIDNKIYFWVAYKQIIVQNPLLSLSIKSKNKLKTRINKLIDAKLILLHTEPIEGNKTYFFITAKCRNLLNSNNLTTQQSQPYDPTVATLTTQQSYNNIIIDNKINNISTTTTKIESNLNLINLISTELNKTNEQIKSKIPIFLDFIKSTEKEHKNDSDLFSHFHNWIKKQPFKNESLKFTDKEIVENLNWFIKKFNNVCNGNYKATAVVKELFVKQLENGFNGEQMVLAVTNLYSSDDLNKFNKQTNYQHATPEFLLKNDNVNKYLNVKYGKKELPQYRRIISK